MWLAFTSRQGQGLYVIRRRSLPQGVKSRHGQKMALQTDTIRGLDAKVRELEAEIAILLTTSKGTGAELDRSHAVQGVQRGAWPERPC